jgi:hypothetical protein
MSDSLSLAHEAVLHWRFDRMTTVGPRRSYCIQRGANQRPSNVVARGSVN